MLVGTYEVLDLIGDGGMGAVYRGRDPRFDREMAIKVLHTQFRRDLGVVERFKSEAVIQAKLNHPNIVTVLDFIAEPEMLAIVMEYVEGFPLDRVIARAGGPLPVQRTVRLMEQVLSAMAFAHRRGLVHRDIKPSNILVQHLEGQEYAKVMDFGIAKILGSEKLRTATGAKMGTLAYMSPEHVRSPKHVDARSDIYALGVVLYEMLTGRVPFDADSEYELMRQIVEEQPPPIQPLALGGVLAGGVARALAKDPAARFASCEEFRAALGQAGYPPGAVRGEPNPSRANQQLSTGARSWPECPPAATPPANAQSLPHPTPGVPQAQREGALAAALYEEWVLRKRRELAEESKRASLGCQVVGCLSPLMFCAVVILPIAVVGENRLSDGDLPVLLTLAATFVAFVVWLNKRGKDNRISEMVDRYETEAQVKRAELGIADDFMRQC